MDLQFRNPQLIGIFSIFKVEEDTNLQTASAQLFSTSAAEMEATVTQILLNRSVPVNAIGLSVQGLSNVVPNNLP